MAQATIINCGKRFQISIDYNKQANESFKTMPKFFYDQINKLWSFPIDCQEDLTNKLQKLNVEIIYSAAVDNNNQTLINDNTKTLKRKLTFDDDENNNKALKSKNTSIYQSSLNIKIKPIYCVELIAFFKTISKYFYDKENQEWTLPLQSYSSLINKLNQFGIAYETNTKNNSETTDQTGSETNKNKTKSTSDSDTTTTTTTTDDKSIIFNNNNKPNGNANPNNSKILIYDMKLSTPWYAVLSIDGTIASVDINF